MRFDLHAHTTASDGSYEPAELVRTALDRGLDALAITDHDSVDGIVAARDAAQDTALRLIPAVELSAVHGGRDIHILGFFIDVDDPRLAATLAELREARLERARAMVSALQQAGYDVDLDDVLDLSQSGSVGRSHVARALVRRGHAESVREAFERFIGRGKPFYVPKPVSTPEAVVACVRSAGGVAVIAHPGITKVDDLVGPLATAGLAGIEAYHADHSPEQVAHYVAMAKRLSMIVTGGSDYHGPGSPGADLGSVPMPDAVLEGLLALAS